MAAGLDPAGPWAFSAREAMAILAGAERRGQREHDELMTAAWITARLSAYPPEKSDKFLKLEKLLIVKPSRKKKQDWKTQAAILATW